MARKKNNNVSMNAYLASVNSSTNTGISNSSSSNSNLIYTPTNTQTLTLNGNGSTYWNNLGSVSSISISDDYVLRVSSNVNNFLENQKLSEFTILALLADTNITDLNFDTLISYQDLTMRIIEEYYYKMSKVLFYEPVSKHAMAYRIGRSIATNARYHVGREMILKLDISKFFDHITYEMVKEKVEKRGIDDVHVMRWVTAMVAQRDDLSPELVKKVFFSRLTLDNEKYKLAKEIKSIEYDQIINKE